MSLLTLLLYEWKHFSRSPFKVVAVILFVLAGIYALHNGADLYHEQVKEIERIKAHNEKRKQETLAFYEQGKKGPDDRPWVDVNTPFWAIWYAVPTHFKEPSPAMVYSIGQSEQYGFYKQVTFQSSPYDADMAEEIANPERLQSGTLDFSFVLLYLLPLLLLILLYNLRGAEADMKFLPLIQVQIGSKGGWLLARIGFYFSLLVLILMALMLYGASLTGVFPDASDSFGKILLLLLLYLSLWTGLYFLVIRTGKGSVTNTLKMAGLWLVFSFVIPAIVHQWVSIRHPVNLMTDWIDAKRDERNKMYDQPDSVLQAKLNALFPEILESPLMRDSIRKNLALNRSATAMANELLKNSLHPIERDNAAKNAFIRRTYCFNPTTFFQNQLNALSHTHYQDYQDYREEIQVLIDKQIGILVLDTWYDVRVDKKKYLEYQQKLSTS